MSADRIKEKIKIHTELLRILVTLEVIVLGSSLNLIIEKSKGTTANVEIIKLFVWIGVIASLIILTSIIYFLNRIYFFVDKVE